MSMLFTTSEGDSQDMPKPSLIQQFTNFEKNGGNIEEFCMIAGISNSQQLMYTTALRVGNGISFRHQTLKIKPETQGKIGEVQKKIAQTLAMISGLKRIPELVIDTDNEENLGANYIGNH